MLLYLVQINNPYIDSFSTRRIPYSNSYYKVFNAIQIAGINVQPFQGDKVVSNLLLFDDINHEDNLQMEKK